MTFFLRSKDLCELSINVILFFFQNGNYNKCKFNCSLSMDVARVIFV